MRLLGRVPCGVVVVVVAAAAALSRCAPEVVMSMMRPDAASFDDEVHPPAPNYVDDDAWLALPSTVDEADVALDESPAVGLDAGVDVFFLHSTSSLRPRWNTGIEDEEARAASIRGGTLIQASAFNKCCRVFAPAYRQATGSAFTEPSASGELAKDLAFGDVKAAFAEFRRRAGARPFILAGHSQGSVLGARLLKEVITGEEPAHLVAAYLIGAPLTVHDVGGAPACASPTQTGCVVTYNARGPGHDGAHPLELIGPEPAAERLCVNPVLGAASGSMAPSSSHHGALFFDARAPAVLPAFVSAQCSSGRLVLTGMRPMPERDALSGALLWVMGGENFHAIEYQLFYVDLRLDAARRAASFLEIDTSATR